MSDSRSRRDVVVFATTNEAFLNDKVFDREFASRYPGLSAICSFGALARKAGFTVMTADRALSSGTDGNRMLVVSEQAPPAATSLRERGALLTVLYSIETPCFAWRFYRRLPTVCREYRYTFAVSGARERIPPKASRFTPILFPQPSRHVSAVGSNPWEKRSFMAVVNSNVARMILRPSHWLAYISDPAVRHSYYAERRRAICHFSRRPDFHLYGRHWDQKRWGVSSQEHRAALRCYQGACQDKLATLSGYRFSLCFEPTAFPGYLTEKVFDCFYAGCVPIYLGPPDIDNFLPRDCFIDFRRFKDYRELEGFLDRFTPEDFARHRDAAAAFMASSRFDRFTDDHFAHQLLAAVEETRASVEERDV